MAAPRITLRCDCDKSEAYVAYGERWTCESCGRTYDTKGIPAEDFEAIETLRRRYRIAGYAGVSLVAAFVLVLALTAQEFQLFIGLPFIVLVGSAYVGRLMRSGYRRRVGERQRTGTLRAEGELGGGATVRPRHRR